MTLVLIFGANVGRADIPYAATYTCSSPSIQEWMDCFARIEQAQNEAADAAAKAADAAERARLEAEARRLAAKVAEEKRKFVMSCKAGEISNCFGQEPANGYSGQRDFDTCGAKVSRQCSHGQTNFTFAFLRDCKFDQMYMGKGVCGKTPVTVTSSPPKPTEPKRPYCVCAGVPKGESSERCYFWADRNARRLVKDECERKKPISRGTMMTVECRTDESGVENKFSIKLGIAGTYCPRETLGETQRPGQGATQVPSGGSL